MIKTTIKSSVLAFAFTAIAGFGSASNAGVFDQLVGVANSALPAYGRDQVESFLPDWNQEQMTRAIHEVLEVASDRVAEQVLAEHGYEGDSAIRLSADLRKVQKLAAKGGHEGVFEQFEQQLVEAVIAAAPATRDLLKTAMAEVEILEPRVLLIAHDTAVTDYYRMRITEKLQRQLQPVVAELLLESGAKVSGEKIASKIEFGNLLETMTTDHVVDYTVDSFFLQLERQERDIRHNPESRSTDLLRIVFG